MSSRVLVLGSTSRVGHHFLQHPPRAWVVESAGRSDPRSVGVQGVAHTPLDLSDRAAVRSFLRSSTAEAWVNFAARTDVDGCEAERPAEPGPSSPNAIAGSAWQLNAELPRWISEEAERQGRFFVQFSTDYVFDGERGPYPERAPPSPFSPRLSWYGYSKGAGEHAVSASNGPHAIVRIAHPFGSAVPGRTDLALTLLARRREGSVFPLYTDQQITPTWIPDVSDALGAILERAATGTFHVASPDVTTPFEFARTLFVAGGFRSDDLVTSTLASANPPEGRAPRPVRGGLLVQEVHRLDVRPRSFREGIRCLFEGSPGVPRPGPPKDGPTLSAPSAERPGPPVRPAPRGGRTGGR